MYRKSEVTNCRSTGFTLVELLVVITIRADVQVLSLGRLGMVLGRRSRPRHRQRTARRMVLLHLAVHRADRALSTRQRRRCEQLDGRPARRQRSTDQHPACRSQLPVAAKRRSHTRRLLAISVVADTRLTDQARSPSAPEATMPDAAAIICLAATIFCPAPAVSRTRLRGRKTITGR